MMAIPRIYATAGAFRRALEDRLKIMSQHDQIERALIDRALAKCGGVKTKAADFLGINRNTLNKKVKDLGIEAAE